MTALETFTTASKATLDHGAPSRHGRYLHILAIGIAITKGRISPKAAEKHKCARRNFAGREAEN